MKLPTYREGGKISWPFWGFWVTRQARESTFLFNIPSRFVSVYRDFDRDCYLYVLIWVAPFVWSYWHLWRRHKYDIHRWCFRRGIIGLPHDGAHYKDWNWNHPRYWFKGRHYTSNLTVKPEKK